MSQSEGLTPDLWVAESDDWEWSPEGVHYRLSPVGIDDDQTISLIVETICRLPREIAEFALDRCFFVSVGPANNGITLPGRLVSPKDEKWLIVLEERIRPQDAHGIVAHRLLTPGLDTIGPQRRKTAKSRPPNSPNNGDSPGRVPTSPYRGAGCGNSRLLMKALPVPGQSYEPGVHRGYLGGFHAFCRQSAASSKANWSRRGDSNSRPTVYKSGGN